MAIRFVPKNKKTGSESETTDKSDQINKTNEIREFKKKEFKLRIQLAQLGKTSKNSQIYKVLYHRWFMLRLEGVSRKIFRFFVTGYDRDFDTEEAKLYKKT